MSNAESLNRRTALALMAAGLATIAGRSFAAGPVEQKSLEIGANRDPQLGAHVAIAATKGYFKDEGLDVKVHWTQVSGDLQPLLAGGAISIAAFGMHSTIMDGAVVESGAWVAAGAIVTPGKRIPKGQIWAGNPAKYFRELKPEETSFIPVSCQNYVDLAAEYLSAGIS